MKGRPSWGLLGPWTLGKPKQLSGGGSGHHGSVRRAARWQSMSKSPPAPPHPHAEAIYRVVALDDGTFAVEVLIPETFPTLVTGIKSQDAAEAWIARHKATTKFLAQHQAAAV